MATEQKLIRNYAPSQQLSPLVARDWFKARIAAKEPASLIRLGDGEFSWLGYGELAPWEQTSFSLKVWFGRDDFPSSQLLQTANRLKEAVRNATVVGLPRGSRQQRDPFCAAVDEIFDSFNLTQPGQLFTDCGVHRYWQMLLAYRDLLDDLPFLGIVTCRDISERVKTTFRIKEVELYPIPSERKALGAFESQEPHYPQRFEQLCEEISVPYRGAVFLVGAGALGKIYADVIFQRGGIAIDVGSTLDGWSGVPSRGFLRQDPAVFGLECYAETCNLGPDDVITRYRSLLRSVFYSLRPTEEEISFYSGGRESQLPMP
jgi:hypothetical protein